MGLQLEIRDSATGLWQLPPQGPVRLGERSRLRLTLRRSGAAARLFVGDVLVASSERDDQAEHRIQRTGMPAVSWEVVGRLLRDWVGETELRFEVCNDVGDWVVADTISPVYVEPERLRPEEFAALCDAVAAESADLLYDVYGKTGFGSVRGGRSSVAPAAIIARIRSALDQLAAALSEIARQPAYRLKTRRVREPAMHGQAVSDLTLEEACLDPGLAVMIGDRVHFREQVREFAWQNFRLPENHTIADFLAFLRQQLGDLRTALEGEMSWREAQRWARDRPGPDGQPSWWATEDRPRIEECGRIIRQADLAVAEVNRLAQYSFLPPGRPLAVLPPVTPLVRTHRAYAGAYRVIAEHFGGHRLRIDAAHLITRARSVPVLYEWWCALEVLRILRGCFESAGGASFGRRLETDQGRYVVDFATDQRIEFRDLGGRRVCFRYQPIYRPVGPDEPYGLLGRGQMRTPDQAIEIFAAGESAVPEMIIILDAKYTSAPHAMKLETMKLRYDRIGDYETGRVLGRQIWALVPTRPPHPGLRESGLEAACTTDNTRVFAPAFDPSSAAVGVIHAAPLTGPGRSAVEGLLRHLFARLGLQTRLSD